MVPFFVFLDLPLDQKENTLQRVPSFLREDVGYHKRTVLNLACVVHRPLALEAGETIVLRIYREELPISLRNIIVH